MVGKTDGLHFAKKNNPATRERDDTEGPLGKGDRHSPPREVAAEKTPGPRTSRLVTRFFLDRVQQSAMPKVSVAVQCFPSLSADIDAVTEPRVFVLQCAKPITTPSRQLDPLTCGKDVYCAQRRNAPLLALFGMLSSGTDEEPGRRACPMSDIRTGGVHSIHCKMGGSFKWDWESTVPGIRGAGHLAGLVRFLRRPNTLASACRYADFNNEHLSTVHRAPKRPQWFQLDRPVPEIENRHSVLTISVNQSLFLYGTICLIGFQSCTYVRTASSGKSAILRGRRAP